MSWFDRHTNADEEHEVRVVNWPGIPLREGVEELGLGPRGSALSIMLQ